MSGPEAVASRNRLVVINLDDEWPFVDLVRRLALDLYATARRETIVEFRTLSSVRKPIDQAQAHLVWGTRWPRDYGDDTVSLQTDLIDDLVSVDTQGVERMALLVVLPDPTSGAERIEFALSVARRLEERIDGHDGLRARVLRIAALRAGANGQRSRFSAAWWPTVRRLLSDPTNRGRQPFDGLVVLRRPTVRTEKEDVQAHQFILLRGLAELVGAAWRTSAPPSPGEVQTRASSAAEFLRYLRQNPVALELPGQYPELSSERIARLLAAYREHAIGQPAGQSAMQRGDDAANEAQAGVNRLITGIKEYVDNTYRAISTPPPPPGRWTELGDQTALWSRDAEEGFVRSVKTDMSELRRWSEQCLLDIAHRKAALFEEVLRSRDSELRKHIAGIRLTNAGLSGEAGTMIDTLKRAVWTERTRLLERAAENRLKYVFAVIPSEGGTAPVPQVEAWFERLAIERLPEYAAYEGASKAVHAAVRKLIPRRYWLVPLTVAAAALATIFAHELALARGPLVLASLLAPGRPVLYLAWLLAVISGTYFIATAIRRRRNHMRQAVERLFRQRDDLAGRVHEMLDAAVGYLVVTTQIVWLDLLCHELDQRGAENDVKAYNSALSRIAPDPRRPPRFPPSQEEKVTFFNRRAASVSQERVTRWVTVTLEQIDPEADLPANRLDVAFAGSLGADPGDDGPPSAPGTPATTERGGDYALESRLFLEPARINYRTLVMPEAVMGRDEVNGH